MTITKYNQEQCRIQKQVQIEGYFWTLFLAIILICLCTGLIGCGGGTANDNPDCQAKAKAYGISGPVQCNPPTQ